MDADIPLDEAGQVLAGHVGFPAAVQSDGSELSTWTVDFESSTVGYRAVCDCGWRGAVVHPGATYPDGAAYDEVMEEWHQHMGANLAQLELLASIAEMAGPLARLRWDVRQALERGSVLADVAKALGVEDGLVEALVSIEG